MHSSVHSHIPSYPYLLADPLTSMFTSTHTCTPSHTLPSSLTHMCTHLHALAHTHSPILQQKLPADKSHCHIPVCQPVHTASTSTRRHQHPPTCMHSSACSSSKATHHRCYQHMCAPTHTQARACAQGAPMFHLLTSSFVLSATWGGTSLACALVCSPGHISKGV